MGGISLPRAGVALVDNNGFPTLEIEGVGQYQHKAVSPFLYQFGQFYKPQPLPKGYGWGGFRQCYKNSYNMAMRHGVAYVEGVACKTGTGLMLHAWCTDGKGNVLDRTWKDGMAYFGVPIKADYLKTVIASRKSAGDLYYGLLDDWKPGFPLVRQHGDLPDLWLATA